MSSNRFQILDIPVALPGKCVVCGYAGGDARKFIDFGFDIDFYGVVYFCSACFESACKELDWGAPKVMEAFRAKIDSLESSLQVEMTVNAKLRSALNLLDFLGTGPIHDDIPAPATENKRRAHKRPDESSPKSGLEPVPEDDEREFSLEI